MSPTIKGQTTLHRHVARLLAAMVLVTMTFVPTFADADEDLQNTTPDTTTVQDVDTADTDDTLNGDDAENTGEPVVGEEEPAGSEPTEPATEDEVTTQQTPVVTTEPTAEPTVTPALTTTGTTTAADTAKVAAKKAKKNGWIKGKYYVNGKVKTGLFKVNGRYFYANKKGVAQKNKLITVNGAKYYFGRGGAALTGYIKINNNTRYIANSKTAKIQTGWITYKGRRYYALGNGRVVRNGMKRIGGYTFHFNNKGVMTKNATKTIGGYKYTFNNYGVMIRKAPTGATVAKTAVKYVGKVPYVWAGSSLKYGVDCSGFTMCIYRQYGYYLPHSSSSQAYCGKAVSLKNIQPGDLCIWSGHVAMYIGGGKIVHATNPVSGIRISSLNYGRGYPHSIRRIV